jgi:hypothetical protein
VGGAPRFDRNNNQGREAAMHDITAALLLALLVPTALLATRVASTVGAPRRPARWGRLRAIRSTFHDARLRWMIAGIVGLGSICTILSLLHGGFVVPATGLVLAAALAYPGATQGSRRRRIEATAAGVLLAAVFAGGGLALPLLGVEAPAFGAAASPFAPASSAEHGTTAEPQGRPSESAPAAAPIATDGTPVPATPAATPTSAVSVTPAATATPAATPTSAVSATPAATPTSPAPAAPVTTGPAPAPVVTITTTVAPTPVAPAPSYAPFGEQPIWGLIEWNDALYEVKGPLCPARGKERAAATSGLPTPPWAIAYGRATGFRFMVASMAQALPGLDATGAGASYVDAADVAVCGGSALGRFAESHQVVSTLSGARWTIRKGMCVGFVVPVALYRPAGDRDAPAMGQLIHGKKPSHVAIVTEQGFSSSNVDDRGNSCTR